MFSFMASYLPFKKKKIEREKDMIHEKNSKKQKDAKKNVIILSNSLNCIFGMENVEIWISLFI